MLVSKVTVGFVVQTFDQELGRFTSQAFIAGDQVDYEDDNGNPVDADECKVERGDIMSEPYIGFDMIQPQDDPRITINEELQLAICTCVDLANDNIYGDGDPELDETCKAQHAALGTVVKMLEECRRQRDNMPTNEVKPTNTVNAELVSCCENALADLEGIMPEFEPSGDREHPGWLTIEELKATLGRDVSPGGN